MVQNDWQPMDIIFPWLFWQTTNTLMSFPAHDTNYFKWQPTWQDLSVLSACHYSWRVPSVVDNSNYDRSRGKIKQNECRYPGVLTTVSKWSISQGCKSSVVVILLHCCKSTNNCALASIQNRTLEKEIWIQHVVKLNVERSTNDLIKEDTKINWS
jgi:hypothetical protein